MRHGSIFAAATFALTLLAGTAYAGDMYQSTVIESPASVNKTAFHFLKPGNKLKITPSPASKPGTALTVQLILKNVDCAPNNDGGKAGKCGVVGAPEHAVLDLSVRQYIAPGDMMHVAGVPISFTKGVATFDATGKNKADGGDVFGTLVGAFLNQKAGFHVTLIRAQGSNPADCSSVPLPDGNGCLDGTEIGLTGMTTSS